MDIKTLKKYLRIYITLFRFSIIHSTTYRVSFLTELFVEVGYQIIFVLFFYVVLSNVSDIAGWTYYEVLFLNGLDIVTIELLLGATYIFGLWRLPENIKNGEIDMALLKPLNALFNLTLARPYFSSIAATLPGVGLMCYAFFMSGHRLTFAGSLWGVILMICGLTMTYCVGVIISSFSFRFLNTTTLPKIAEYAVTEYTRNPHDVYRGLLRVIFFLVVPAVFLSSIPARTLLSGVEMRYAILGIALTALFLALAIAVWNHMIRHYSSASS